MNRLSKNLPTTCEVLGVIHYDYNVSNFSFVEQRKEILSEAYRIAGKIVHSKTKKENTINSIRKGTILFRNKKKYAIENEIELINKCF